MILIFLSSLVKIAIQFYYFLLRDMNAIKGKEIPKEFHVKNFILRQNITTFALDKYKYGVFLKIHFLIYL